MPILFLNQFSQQQNLMSSGNMKERLFAGCLEMMFLLWPNFLELAWYRHQSILYPTSQTILFVCVCLCMCQSVNQQLPTGHNGKWFCSCLGGNVEEIQVNLVFKKPANGDTSVSKETWTHTLQERERGTPTTRSWFGRLPWCVADAGFVHHRLSGRFCTRCKLAGQWYDTRIHMTTSQDRGHRLVCWRGSRDGGLQSATAVLL